MGLEFASSRPSLLFSDLSRQLSRDGFDFNAGSMRPWEIERTYSIVEAARRIIPEMCQLKENEGKTGFVLAITKKIKNFPILTVQIGTVTDRDLLYSPNKKKGKISKYVEFANKKARLLQNNPTFISSSENLLRSPSKRVRSSAGHEIPGGGLAFGEWIVSGSAFKVDHIDEAAVLAIAVASRLTSLDGAEQIARDPRVRSHEFMFYEDKILMNPIFG